jgi:hypothetical protein
MESAFSGFIANIAYGHNDRFLNNRQRYQPIKLRQNFSDKEMARDWTLSEADIKEVVK